MHCVCMSSFSLTNNDEAFTFLKYLQEKTRCAYASFAILKYNKSPP